MRIREATRQDLERLVELLAQDDFGSQREGPGPAIDETYLSAFDAMAHDPNHCILVGEADSEVACMLQLSFLPHLTFRGGWRAQIEGVRVAANSRGQGLGGELLAEAVRRAGDRGCHLVQLTTNKSRTQALRFYESFGFEATHEGMKLYLEGSVTGR